MISKPFGFTLVEVLVAMLVIALGATGLVAAQRAFVQSSTATVTRLTAIRLAQQQIEQFRGVALVELVAGEATLEEDGIRYRLQWHVEPQHWNLDHWQKLDSESSPKEAYGAADAVALTLTVSWGNTGNNKPSLSVTTWFSELFQRNLKMHIN